MAVNINITAKTQALEKSLREIPGLTEREIKKAVNAAGRAWKKGESLSKRAARDGKRRAQDLANSLQKNYEHAFRSGNALLGSFMGDIEDGIELAFGLGKSFAMLGPHGMAAVAAVTALTGAIAGASAVVVGFTAVAASAVYHVEAWTKANEKYVDVLELSRVGNAEAIEAGEKLRDVIDLTAVAFKELGIRIAQDAAPEIEYLTHLFAGLVFRAIDSMNALESGALSISNSIKEIIITLWKNSTPVLTQIIDTFLQVNKIASSIALYAGQEEAARKLLQLNKGIENSRRVQEQLAREFLDREERGFARMIDFGVGINKIAEEGRTRLGSFAEIARKIRKEQKETASQEQKALETKRQMSALRDKELAQAQNLTRQIADAHRSAMVAMETEGDGRLQALEKEKMVIAGRLQQLLKARDAELVAEEAFRTAYEQSLELLGDVDQRLADRRLEIRQKADEEYMKRQEQLAQKEAALTKQRQAAQVTFAQTVTGGFIQIAEAAGANAQALAAAKLLETIAYQAVAIARAFAEGGILAGPIAAASAAATIGVQIANLARAANQSAPTSTGPSRAVSSPREISEQRGFGGGSNQVIVVNEYRGQVFDAQLRDSKRRKGSPLRDSKSKGKARNG